MDFRVNVLGFIYTKCDVNTSALQVFSRLASKWHENLIVDPEIISIWQLKIFDSVNWRRLWNLT